MTRDGRKAIAIPGEPYAAVISCRNGSLLALRYMPSGRMYSTSPLGFSPSTTNPADLINSEAEVESKMITWKDRLAALVALIPLALFAYYMLAQSPD